MSLWDGFLTDDNSFVCVIGTTNRPFDVDEAIQRRMPLTIEIDLPNASQRELILRKVRILLSYEPLFLFFSVSFVFQIFFHFFFIFSLFFSFLNCFSFWLVFFFWTKKMVNKKPIFSTICFLSFKKLEFKKKQKK